MPLRKLDDLELNIALEGCEGLDVNYVSRIRAQYLFIQHQTMITQMQFADAKAAALIALVGVAAVRGPIPIGQPEAYGTIGYAFLMCAGFSIMFAILSVFPRYPSKRRRESLSDSDRWSWPALTSSQLNAEAFADYIRTAEVSQLVHSIAISNSFIAKILLSKYRMLRLGFFFGLATLVILGFRVVGVM